MLQENRKNLLDILDLTMFKQEPYFVGNEAKGRISKRVFQENKARQIFRGTNICYRLIRTRTFAYQGLRNVLFFGKFGVLCFLKTPVLRFVFLYYYRRRRIPSKIYDGAFFQNSSQLLAFNYFYKTFRHICLTEF